VLLVVAFLRFLDYEQSLSSPNFSEKVNGTTLSVFQSIQFLSVTRLVASGQRLRFCVIFWNISHVWFGYCSLVLVRGSFQASLLGTSVMTAYVRLYLPCNGHNLAIVTKALGRNRKPIIL